MGYRPRIPRERVVEAFALASKLSAATLPSSGEGYRLFYAQPPNVRWIDLVVSEHAIVGSHERCDLVIPEEPGMRTRQALVTCSRLEDGTPALRLIDLRTDLPFFLMDDEPHSSLVVTGSFAVRLGQGVIGAVSHGSETGRPQARALPAASELPTSEVHHSSRVPRTTGVPVGGHRRTYITSLPPVSPVGTMKSGITSIHPDDAGSAVRSAPIRSSRTYPSSPIDSRHRLTLTRGKQAASIEVVEDVLELGLLIGRAENCEDGGLRQVLDGTISRAHLLIAREGPKIAAYDLASLNGTKVQGAAQTIVVTRSQRRIVLPPEGATLVLSSEHTLRWHAVG